jgi:hypothetical protein
VIYVEIKQHTKAHLMIKPCVIPVGGIVMNKWTVWVGGSEVNLCYLSETQAHNMAQAWRDKGYDDVVVEEIK